KGISGNPKGRPKQCRNFDEELIRESSSLMTINENGRPKRVSKHKVAVKQLIKLAMTGSTQALRIYFERINLAAASQTNKPGKSDSVKDLTGEELMQIAIAGSKKK